MQLAQKIIIADDHPLFRTAMQQAVKQLVPDVTIEQAESLPELQQVVEQHKDADLVLLDLQMPGAHGYSGLVFLRSHYPEIPVIVVSACEDPAIMCQAIDHEASGYIPKSSPLDHIAKAIEQVLQGDIYLPDVARRHQHQPNQNALDLAERLASLTPQQFRVLTMMAEGMLNKQIAYDLDVSEATIKAHVTAIFRKLGVRTRTQAVIAVQSLDIEKPEAAMSGQG
ncbi:response regulator transcription factor [Thalassolituus marinus]|uniref:Response regulator transcription factor n=1 Tax=Thalassolituus marinus TaxID=671053 RepID=A0ABS7ZUB0_9GAMM|nr:response regulator transcription factor [Thalassolituus marinus]MCA6063976.1 response regulator transcription factor [Thalassolituus marinus]